MESNLNGMSFNPLVQKNNIIKAENELVVLKREKGIIESEREDVAPHWTSDGARQTLEELDKFLNEGVTELENVFKTVEELLIFVKGKSDAINSVGL